jgi:hypothetical protein
VCPVVLLLGAAILFRTRRPKIEDDKLLREAEEIKMAAEFRQLQSETDNFSHRKNRLQERTRNCRAVTKISNLA